jgi:uncharacterized protein YmfQ (DUF2313 family)
MSKRHSGAEAEAVLPVATGVTSAVSPSGSRVLIGRWGRVTCAPRLYGTTRSYMDRQALKGAGARIAG